MTADDIVGLVFLAWIGIYVVFHTIPTYLSSRKEHAKYLREKAAAEEARRSAQKKENERRATLRQRDAEVDPLLRRLVEARTELQRLIKRARIDFTIDRADVARLHEWAATYADVMDFDPFAYACSEFPRIDDEEPCLFVDEVRSALREAEPDWYLSYADEKLGIKRDMVLVDVAGGPDGGWWCERADGRKEPVRKRIHRALGSSKWP